MVGCRCCRQAALSAESAEHGDLLQEPFTEHYQNLTLKSVFMLKWLAGSRCGRAAPFAVKVDDDMWVDMPAMLAFLGGCDAESAVVAGKLYTGASAYRETRSKYYLPPQLHPEDNFPPYTSGGGYVMNRVTSEILYKHALDTPFINLEDLFLTGLVAERAGVRRVSAPGFEKARPLWLHPCTVQGSVTVHGLGPAQLRWMWGSRGAHCGPLWVVVRRL